MPKEEIMTPNGGSLFYRILSGGPDMTGHGAIRRILVACAWFGAVVALGCWVCLGWEWALGLAGGVVIGAANLVFLAALIRRIMIAERRKPARIALVMAAKIIVVYGGLAALLVWKVPPILGVVSGFTLVLIVITLKAVGRALLGSRALEAQAKLDRTENRRSDS